MRLAALVAALLGLVACSPGERASVASTTAWRPLAGSTLAPGCHFTRSLEYLELFR